MADELFIELSKDYTLLMDSMQDCLAGMRKLHQDFTQKLNTRTRNLNNRLQEQPPQFLKRRRKIMTKMKIGNISLKERQLKNKSKFFYMSHKVRWKLYRCILFSKKDSEKLFPLIPHITLIRAIYCIICYVIESNVLYRYLLWPIYLLALVIYIYVE